MLRLKDTLGGEPITFNYCETRDDADEMLDFIWDHKSLGMDTESTGINPYVPGWELRTFQVGNADTAYIISAKRKGIIAAAMQREVNWIGHNGPHDIRSIDAWLGEDTGVRCAGETYLPAHYHDSRKREDGGTGHKLKEQSVRYVASDANKWEDALKAVFKTIEIPIPGQTYKSGPRKGKQKVRKARLDEGWSLIDPEHPAYIAYAGADPIITFRLWRHYQSVVRNNLDLYHFDRDVQYACDKLTRRAMRLDVEYTKKLDAKYLSTAEDFKRQAAEMGVVNINSGQQIAAELIDMGVVLTDKTPTGKYKTDDKVLRQIQVAFPGTEAAHLIHCILAAKQMLKRRESYTESMLREMDGAGRVHPSINTMGARTTRMSVSGPPLQQLPTKDREADE